MATTRGTGATASGGARGATPSGTAGPTPAPHRPAPARSNIARTGGAGIMPGGPTVPAEKRGDADARRARERMRQPNAALSDDERDRIIERYMGDGRELSDLTIVELAALASELRIPVSATGPGGTSLREDFVAALTGDAETEDAGSAGPTAARSSGAASEG